MTGRRVRVVGGVAGIAFVVIALIALFLPGTPPKANEAAAKIGSYFVSKRGSILASDFLIGVAVTFFLVFAGSLRLHVGAASRDGVRPGAGLLGGAAVGAALLLAGVAVTNGAAFRIAAVGDSNLNTALYDVSSGMAAISGFGFAAFFIAAALSISATRALPAALAPAAGAVALIEILSGIALFAKSGFFATGGAFGYIAVLVALGWVLAASVALLRPGGDAGVPAAAPAA